MIVYVYIDRCDVPKLRKMNLRRILKYQFDFEKDRISLLWLNLNDVT